ncbi:MAG: hypothetical protein PHS44_03905 [Candidatus Dojkabacteria bacterium]|nr:hypothetical protein [Candidatus Dojkabacteria bacterium]
METGQDDFAKVYKQQVVEAYRGGQVSSDSLRVLQLLLASNKDAAVLRAGAQTIARSGFVETSYRIGEQRVSEPVGRMTVSQDQAVILCREVGDLGSNIGLGARIGQTTKAGRTNVILSVRSVQAQVALRVLGDMDLSGLELHQEADVEGETQGPRARLGVMLSFVGERLGFLWQGFINLRVALSGACGEAIRRWHEHRDRLITRRAYREFERDRAAEGEIDWVKAAAAMGSGKTGSDRRASEREYEIPEAIRSQVSVMVKDLLRAMFEEASANGVPGDEEVVYEVAELAGRIERIAEDEPFGLKEEEVREASTGLTIDPGRFLGSLAGIGSMARAGLRVEGDNLSIVSVDRFAASVDINIRILRSRKDPIEGLPSNISRERLRQGLVAAFSDKLLEDVFGYLNFSWRIPALDLGTFRMLLPTKLPVNVRDYDVIDTVVSRVGLERIIFYAFDTTDLESLGIEIDRYFIRIQNTVAFAGTIRLFGLGHEEWTRARDESLVTVFNTLVMRIDQGFGGISPIGTDINIRSLVPERLKDQTEYRAQVLYLVMANLLSNAGLENLRQKDNFTIRIEDAGPVIKELYGSATDEQKERLDLRSSIIYLLD